MPTPFAMVVFGVVVLAAVVGVVLLVRQTIRRSKGPFPSHGPSPRGTSPETPWDESTAAAQTMREADRGGWGI